MITKQFTFLFTFLLLSLCESFSVESLPKCQLKDSECQRSLYQNMIRDIGKTGIPELGIPVVDPIVLKNVSVEVLGLVNITMVDGVAKGIRNCIFERFEIDVEKKRGSQAIICDLIIKGHYAVSANSPLIGDLVGNGGISGEGNGKVVLEKIYMTMDFPFYFEKHDDGEIYIKCLYKEIDYTYDIRGNAFFAADNIYVGKNNISEFVVKYLNDNWKFLMRTFGKSFIDKAMEYYFAFAKKFFEGVPAKYYIIDDLTPYVKQ